MSMYEQDQWQREGERVARLETIKIDHKKKSSQLQKLKKKMRYRIPISKLKEMLVHEKRYRVNWEDYRSWGSVDDNSYSRDVARQEARVGLLEELIREYGGR